MGKVKFTLYKFRYSASAIGTYEFCPRKFKLQYLDRVPADFEAECLVKGKTIHGLFEQYYKTLPPYSHLHITAISEHCKTLPSEMYLKYKEHVDNFIELNKHIYLSLDGEKKSYFKPIAVEEKLYDEDLNLVGVIDAVYSDGKNVLILDFKTGKPSETINSGYRTQLAIYKHLWDLHNPEMKATHWGLFFSGAKTFDEGLITEDVKQRSVDAMYKKLEDVRKKVEEEIFPETTNNWMCKRCERFKSCKGLLC